MGLVRLVTLMPILATVARLSGRRTAEELEESKRLIDDQGLSLGDESSARYLVASLKGAIAQGKYVPQTESQGGVKHAYIVELAASCSSLRDGTLLPRNSERKYQALKMASITVDSAADLVHVLEDPCARAVVQDTRTEPLQSLPPWGLDMIDGDYFDYEYTLNSLTGSGVDVFVLDTGIDPLHDQLRGRVEDGFDFTGSPNGTADLHGHGTHCAGTIAGETVGVAPGARVFPMKVFSDSGSGTASGIISAVEKVVEIWQARGSSDPPVVMSFSGGGGFNQAMNDAFAEAVTAGIVTVVAAGNYNFELRQNFSPASEPSILTVGALDRSEDRAGFSNYGDLIDIWAPGVNVLSAEANTGSGLTSMSGTSMACPHVSGVVALMLEAHPTWTPAQIESNLKAECSADAGTIKGFASIQLRTWASDNSSACAASGNSLPSCENQEWSQCGGSGFTGSTCCPENHLCEVQNAWYSQCKYHPELESCSNGRYHQCGGIEWGGSTCCPAGWECRYQNDWYSQCLEVV